MPIVTLLKSNGEWNIAGGFPRMPVAQIGAPGNRQPGHHRMPTKRVVAGCPEAVAHTYWLPVTRMPKISMTKISRLPDAQS